MSTNVSISRHSDSVILRCALAMICLRRGCAGLWARERRSLFLTILSLVLVVPVLAQMSASNTDRGTPLSDTRPRRYLFGDWGGKRTALAEKGITLDFFYISV
jgi:carbohydrate-selective porin OprB